MCVHFRALVPEGQSVTGARHGGARVSQCQGASSHGKKHVRVPWSGNLMVPVGLLNICFLLSGVYAGLIFFLWAGSF